MERLCVCVMVHGEAVCVDDGAWRGCVVGDGAWRG